MVFRARLLVELIHGRFLLRSVYVSTDRLLACEREAYQEQLCDVESPSPIYDLWGSTRVVHRVNGEATRDVSNPGEK